MAGRPLACPAGQALSVAQPTAALSTGRHLMKTPPLQGCPTQRLAAGCPLCQHGRRPRPLPAHPDRRHPGQTPRPGQAPAAAFASLPVARPRIADRRRRPSAIAPQRLIEVSPGSSAIAGDQERANSRGKNQRMGRVDDAPGQVQGSSSGAKQIISLVLRVHGGLGEHGAGPLVGDRQQVHGLPSPLAWRVPPTDLPSAASARPARWPCPGRWSLAASRPGPAVLLEMP
jgi:hypothetical protein